MKTTYNVLAVAFILFFSQQVFAEKWVGVGDFYIDTDSIKRSGEIVSANLRKGGQTYGRVDFDCKRRLVFLGTQAIEGTDENIAGSMLAVVCKRTWEIWK